MKRHSTRFLRSVAIFFMTFPLTYILIAATLFDIPLKSCVGILLSPSYYITSITVVITGYGIWELYRWSWYWLIISQLLLLYGNALYMFDYSESYHKALAFFIATLLQGSLIYRIAQDLRVPYLFPKIRWWESNPKYRFSVPVSFGLTNGETKQAEILDVASSGCFIKLRDEPALDSVLTLKFAVFEFSFELEGLVVWLAQSTVTHPKGIGIKFHQLSREQKRSLRHVNRKLKRIATHYRKFRYLLSQEEFLRQLKEIELDSKA